MLQLRLNSKDGPFFSSTCTSVDTRVQLISRLWTKLYYRWKYLARRFQRHIIIMARFYVHSAPSLDGIVSIDGRSFSTSIPTRRGTPPHQVCSACHNFRARETSRMLSIRSMIDGQGLSSLSLEPLPRGLKRPTYILFLWNDTPAILHRLELCRTRGRAKFRVDSNFVDVEWSVRARPY